MSVGAASIKRAASKAATEEAAKKAAEIEESVGKDGETAVETTESEAAPEAKAARETGKKAEKKTSGRKRTSSKKVTSATVPSVSPEVVEKMKLNQNRAVHLTEELPVHLL
ncbi:MAG: hypothetical protein LUD14_02005 [Clostridiales bacterium]|nr:hypothetical protein [Clostridiales bacterium]